MAPLERAMVVSYRLSIVTVALSVTIQPQFAIECLRRSNQQCGWLWAKILGCSPWSRPIMFGSAESKHPRLTNGEIIFLDYRLHQLYNLPCFYRLLNQHLIIGLQSPTARWQKVHNSVHNWARVNSWPVNMWCHIQVQVLHMWHSSVSNSATMKL